MQEGSEVYVGLDTSKLKISVALAAAGREGEVRFLGDIDSTPEAVERLVRKLAKRHQRLFFAYEAGPTGYGLQRQIGALGHDCAVVAPSLIPKRPGERVKTNRRDALALAKLHRAGELTPVWVPDPAMRPCASWCAPGGGDGGPAAQAPAPAVLPAPPRPGLHRPLAPGAGRTRAGSASCASSTPPSTSCWPNTGRPSRMPRRGSSAWPSRSPSWSLLVHGAGDRGLPGDARRRLPAAVTFVAEIGDVRRFDSPRQLMAYLGLVPSESSTGERVRRGGITKAGNSRARRVLIEGAWTYRFPARMSRLLEERQAGLPKAVCDIAWKAQLRLCGRYRKLMARGKRQGVVVAAIAREMAAFLWAIGREVEPLRAG
jgi:transposase